MRRMEVIAIGGFFHDLNFTYLDTNDSNSLISVEEERFSRKKQHSCLNQQSTSIGALEYINQKRQNRNKRIDLLLLSDKADQPIYKYLIEQISPLEILKIGHHRSHAGNIAFFNRDLTSNSKIFIFDAFGDGHSGAVYHNALDLDDHEMFEAKDSIGLIYTAATKHLGLGSFGSEGKMQGLASYGAYRDEYSIGRFLNIQEKKPLIDSTLALNKYGPNQQMYASSIGLDIDYFHEILECRFAGEELNQNHKDFTTPFREISSIWSKE